MPRANRHQGILSFGVVFIPVEIHSAIQDQGIHMHLLHKKCGSRVRNQMFCPVRKVVVERADLVRRFEVSKGKYVQVTEEELQSVEVEANNGIEFRELSRSLLREQLLSGTVNKVPRSRQSAFSLGTIPRLQSLRVDDLMTAPLDR